MLEIKKQDLLNQALLLRDTEKFETLIDLCGVDYLHYGQSDWKTTEATGTGFDRGVEPLNKTNKTNKTNKIKNKLDFEFQPKSRFAVVYQLLSYTHNKRLTVKIYLEDDNEGNQGNNLNLDSVTSIWPSANWYEREAFDLYGIQFNHHPDLRRILTDYHFEGHPFRKDFPVSGHTELQYDEVLKKIIHVPVSLTPRILVPKVIRETRENHG